MVQMIVGVALLIVGVFMSLGGSVLGWLLMAVGAIITVMSLKPGSGGGRSWDDDWFDSDGGDSGGGDGGGE